MILLVQTTPGRGYGAEAVLGHLLRGLPPEERGRVLLATPAASPLKELWNGLGGRSVDLRMGRDALGQSLSAAWRLGGELRAAGVRPGLVFGWSLRATDAALVLGHRLGAPVAGMLHDHPAAPHEGSFRRGLYRWETGRLRALVAVSGAVRSELEKTFGPSPRWRVIRNGLNDLPPNPARPAGAVLRLGFIGMHNAWKGWPVVRDAIALLEDVLPPGAPSPHWKLFGDPLPESAREAAELGVRLRRQKLELRGAVATEQLFSELDLLVHASTRFDPYPTVLLEAARAGLPAVASRLGGGPEIVVPGSTGWVIGPTAPELAEALRGALAGPDALAALGQAARRRFDAEFRVGHMVRQHLELWTELGG